MSGKTAGMRIRVEPDLHEEFLATCKSQEKPAAEVLREFMRGYVQLHSGGRQIDLLISRKVHER